MKHIMGLRRQERNQPPPRMPVERSVRAEASGDADEEYANNLLIYLSNEGNRPFYFFPFKGGD